MIAFAVNVVEVATPFAFVVSVSVFVPLANVPLAPVVGAVKVTAAPLTGCWPLTTVAASGTANAVPTAALCEGEVTGVTLGVAATDFAGVEFELPRPVTKLMARSTEAGRFKAT